jgi:hypothetical protein
MALAAGPYRRKRRKRTRRKMSASATYLIVIVQPVGVAIWITGTQFL